MQRFLGRSASILPLVLVAACGGSKPDAKAPSAPAAAPSASGASPAPAVSAPSGVNVDALLAREVTGGLKPIKAKTPDGGTLAIEAAGDPEFEVKNEVLHIAIPIGTETPVICFVRKDSVATSSILYGMIEGLKKEFPKAGLGALDVGVAGDVPYLFAETQYVAQQDGKETFGALKMAAFERNDDTLLCMHDEIGYRASFRKVTEGLARSLVLPDEAQAETPTELEISIARIGTQRIGYDLSKHWARTDGTHDEAGTSVMLMPASAEHLTAYASGHAITSGKDGVVTKIRTATEEDGEIARDLSVARTAGGKYHVEGTVQGKATKADFTPKKPIWGTWRERNEVRDKMLGGPKVRELSFNYYSPSDDAAGATPSVWKATTEPNVFDTTLGKMEVRQTVDERGRAKLGVAKMGPVEITLERIVVQPASGEGPKAAARKPEAAKGTAPAPKKTDK